MFYVYILHSASIDRYYIGYSANLISRVYKHNARHKGFTSQADDWIIVYSETSPANPKPWQGKNNYHLRRRSNPDKRLAECAPWKIGITKILDCPSVLQSRAVSLPWAWPRSTPLANEALAIYVPILARKRCFV